MIKKILILTAGCLSLTILLSLSTTSDVSNKEIKVEKTEKSLTSPAITLINVGDILYPKFDMVFETHTNFADPVVKNNVCLMPMTGEKDNEIVAVKRNHPLTISGVYDRGITYLPSGQRLDLVNYLVIKAYDGNHTMLHLLFVKSKDIRVYQSNRSNWNLQSSGQYEIIKLGDVENFMKIKHIR